MKQLPFGVNLAGHLRSEKGVGEVSRSIVAALTAANIPYTLHDVEDPGSANTDRRLPGGSSGYNPYAVNLLAFNASGVTDFSAFHGREYFQDRINVGYWNWELQDFPREWFPAFRTLDEIWVPSLFTAEAVTGVSPVPVRQIPLVVSADAPSAPVTRDEFGLDSDTFVFLFAFDFQSIATRKNPFAIVDAFRRAFEKRTDVALLIKVTHSASDPGAFGQLCKAAEASSNIRIVDEVFPRNRMLGLLRMMDCYVSLHRSEGFGLLMAEAMALGKPVIATAYSGNMNFMTEENSLLVDYELIAIEEDHGPYFKGTVWAEPDIEHAAKQMAKLVANPQVGEKLGAQGAADIAAQLSAETVGDMISRRLHDLAGQVHPDQVVVSLRQLQEPTAMNDIQPGLVGRIRRFVSNWNQAERQFEFNTEVGDVISRLSARVKRQEEQIRELQERIDRHAEPSEKSNTPSED